MRAHTHIPSPPYPQGNSKGDCFVYDSGSGERVAHVSAVRVSGEQRRRTGRAHRGDPSSHACAACHEVHAGKQAGVEHAMCPWPADVSLRCGRACSTGAGLRVV